jgi:hypothetical protein
MARKCTRAAASLPNVPMYTGDVAVRPNVRNACTFNIRLLLCVCLYIYIYTHTHTYIYIYIYIYIHTHITDAYKNIINTLNVVFMATLQISLIENRMNNEYSYVIIISSSSLSPLFAALIRPICLPLAPEIRTRNFVRNFPYIAGWGSVEFSEYHDTKTLRSFSSLCPVELSFRQDRVLFQMAHPPHICNSCRSLWSARRSARTPSGSSAQPTLTIVSCAQGMLREGRTPARCVRCFK